MFSTNLYVSLVISKFIYVLLDTIPIDLAFSTLSTLPKALAKEDGGYYSVKKMLSV